MYGSSVSELHGGRPGRREDGMLDYMSELIAKNKRALLLMDKLEIASPKQKPFFDKVRAVLK